MDRASLIAAQEQLAAQHEAERALHLVNAAIAEQLGRTDQQAASKTAAQECEECATARRAVVVELKKQSTAKVEATEISTALKPKADPK